jgi:hypothetical protein
MPKVASKGSEGKQKSLKAKNPSSKPHKGKSSEKVATATTEPCATLGGFGVIQPRPVSCLYRRGSTTGSVTTKKELGISITDFFEYGVGDSATAIPQFVSNYFWEINQNLFDNNVTFPSDLGEEAWCRVRSVKVWVLPVKGFNSVGGNPAAATSNTEAMFTVNVQVPGVAAEPVPGSTPAISDRAFALNTQVTNCLPQIDTHWKQVFHCNLQKTFQSGVARPFIQPFGAQARSQAQCLFQMSIVDPDSGKPYITDANLTIKVKVQLIVDQPISTIQQAGIQVYRNEEFTSPALEQNGTPYSPPTPSYVQMNLQSVMDNLR